MINTFCEIMIKTFCEIMIHTFCTTMISKLCEIRRGTFWSADAVLGHLLDTTPHVYLLIADLTL